MLSVWNMSFSTFKIRRGELSRDMQIFLHYCLAIEVEILFDYKLQEYGTDESAQLAWC